MKLSYPKQYIIWHWILWKHANFCTSFSFRTSFFSFLLPFCSKRNIGWMVLPSQIRYFLLKWAKTSYSILKFTVAFTFDFQLRRDDNETRKICPHFLTRLKTFVLVRAGSRQGIAPKTLPSVSLLSFFTPLPSKEEGIPFSLEALHFLW